MNTYVALCAVGAERILGNEIKRLGYKLKGNAPGRVSFFADDMALYRANMCLRTSDRVYLQMAEYKATDFDELFEGSYRVQWEDVFKKDVRLVVDKVRIYKSTLQSEHSVQSVIQKSIYKRLGDKWHIYTLPESGDICSVRVYITENVVNVLLDTSGEALHKRGYRTDGGVAPLRETTAAVLLQEMLWKRKIPLHDPFCGSGTIVTEAWLYAHNVAPGLGRHFAYEHLSLFNAQKAEEAKKEEASKIRTDIDARITGSDIDFKAVERARVNAEHACVMAGRALRLIESDVHIARPEFVQADFRDLAPPYSSGLILCNPPYGERLGEEIEARALYKEMSGLFEAFGAWDIGVITSQKRFQECAGHYAHLLKNLKAGNLETTLYIYKHQDKNTWLSQ